MSRGWPGSAVWLRGRGCTMGMPIAQWRSVSHLSRRHGRNASASRKGSRRSSSSGSCPWCELIRAQPRASRLACGPATVYCRRTITIHSCRNVRCDRSKRHGTLHAQRTPFSTVLADYPALCKPSTKCAQRLIPLDFTSFPAINCEQRIAKSASATASGMAKWVARLV